MNSDTTDQNVFITYNTLVNLLGSSKNYILLLFSPGFEWLFTSSTNESVELSYPCVILLKDTTVCPQMTNRLIVWLSLFPKEKLNVNDRFTDTMLWVLPYAVLFYPVAVFLASCIPPLHAK